MSIKEKNRLHEKEWQEFLELIKDEPLTKKEKLKQIFDTFITTEEHISAEGLQKLLKGQGINLDLKEIEEALDLFCRLGLASRKDFLGKKPLFEHRHLGYHHDHLICTKCGKIIEFYVPSLEKLQEEIARRYGFKPLEHRLEIYGLCEACQKARAKPSIPLILVSSGERVKVARFLGGSRMQGRLAAMGLTIGEEIEVINNCGPIIISVRGTRLALGHGVASKILVTPLD